MDILYSNVVDAFCIVSSDSDYTRLAVRIRDAGIYVMGVGKKKTPTAFVRACHVFVYTELLQGPVLKKKNNGSPVLLLEEAFEMASEKDGWASMGQLGVYLRQLEAGFDPRNYGFKQLSQLLRAYSHLFEMDADRMRIRKN